MFLKFQSKCLKRRDPWKMFNKCGVNMKINLKDVGCEGVKWTFLPQGKVVQWGALAKRQCTSGSIEGGVILNQLRDCYLLSNYSSPLIYLFC
jgi:hypothetical protein